MKQFFYFLLLFSFSWAVKEEFSDIDVGSLLNDPDALFNLEKRIGKMLADMDTEGQHNTNPDCNALEGVLNNGCEFHTKQSSIIRTKESLAQNAKFLEDISNVSCTRDCTALCCDHAECDTAVYQDKDVHNCYLFKCGSPSMCVFAEHDDYWMSSISKDVHNSHTHTPGPATITHENELQNLGSDLPEQDVAPPVPTTTVKTTTTPKPGLGDHCASYSTQCNDSHAECLMGSCTCRVGYHEKHGICRKHCRDEEFECENVVPGVASRQCVHKSYMCDGSQDCADGSDEYRCPEKDKPAYLDVDSAANLYNSPLYNLPYGTQQDSQYPYGFPIPGLTNQKQPGLLPANQIYPSQLQPQPGNAGGSFYLPVQGQGGSQAGSQLSGQWPYYDKSLNSPLYQNGIPYQTGQQSAYIPPQQQQPSQTGYIPVPQQPVNPVQQVKTNVQPVQPVSQSAGTQYVPTNTGQIPGMPQVNKGIQPPAQQPPAQHQPAAVVPQQSQTPHQDQTQQVQQTKPIVQNPAPDRSRYPIDRYDDSYQDYVGPGKQIDDNSVPQKSQDLDSDVDDLPGGNDYGHFYPKDVPAKEHHRHSEEVDDYDQRPAQVPVTQRPKTVEQTTVIAQNKPNKAKPSAEGYLDYSGWIGYDSNSPRINGKKGPAHKTASKEPKQTTRKPPTTVTQSKGHSIQQETHKSNIDQIGRGQGDRYNTDDRNYNRYPTDGYRGRFDDFDRPTGARRPGYDRYPDRYNSGNRHRPSHGSRYPFYESGYPRGRDRNPYPVWDPMKAEYYYPEDYEDDKDLDAVPGMDSMGTGHRLDYMDVPTDERVSNPRPHNNNIPAPKVHTQDEAPAPTPRPERTEAPVKPVPTTHAPSVTEKVQPADPQPVPSNPDPPVQPPQTGTDSHMTDDSSDDSDEQASQSSDDKDDTDSTNSKIQENQTTNTQSKGNSSGTQSGLGGSGQFKFLNVESVEVDSYTDNSQGPIVALSLGLAITVVLLIFVGCRLRTVKRRLRKGRALHSNEADYLINGMYL